MTVSTRTVWRFEPRLSWTNWTLGIWWTPKTLHAFGMDLGPLELIWRRRLVRHLRRTIR